MISVQEIVKKDDVYTIGPDATMQAAIQIMSTEKISAIPVVEHGKLVGIISKRDYIRKIAAENIPAWSVKIHELMATDVLTVGLNDSVKDCKELMTNNRIRHLPVMDKDELSRIISISDVLSALHSHNSAEEKS